MQPVSLQLRKILPEGPMGRESTISNQQFRHELSKHDNVKTLLTFRRRYILCENATQEVHSHLTRRSGKAYMSHKCNIACDTACGIDMGLRAEQRESVLQLAHPVLQLGSCSKFCIHPGVQLLSCLVHFAGQACFHLPMPCAISSRIIIIIIIILKAWMVAGVISTLLTSNHVAL